MTTSPWHALSENLTAAGLRPCLDGAEQDRIDFSRTALRAQSIHVGRGWCKEWPVLSTWRTFADVAAALQGQLVTVEHQPLGSDVEYSDTRHTIAADDYFGDAAHPAAHGHAYLKDWHLVRELGASVTDTWYTVPDEFCDDWLNAWLDEQHAVDATTSDYRFLYAGPAGTVTALHYDVMRSLSFSVQVMGVKLWIFGPHADDVAAAPLYDAWGNLSTTSLLPPSAAHAIRAAMETIGAEAGRVKEASVAVAGLCFCLQFPGDAVFVPSGVHHQVINLTHAVSINHNWINASCILDVANFVCAECARVRASLEDIRTMMAEAEWHAQVEQLLHRIAGMNLAMVSSRVPLLAHSSTREYMQLGSLLLFGADYISRLHAGDADQLGYDAAAISTCIDMLSEDPFVRWKSGNDSASPKWLPEAWSKQDLQECKHVISEWHRHALTT